MVVDLHRGTAAQVPFPYETNLLDPVFNPPDGSTVGGKETNAFNNSAVLVPVPANMLLAATAKQGNPAPTVIDYVVVTFDRNGNEVDETPLLHYDARQTRLQRAGRSDRAVLLQRSAGHEHPGAVQHEELRRQWLLGCLLLHRHNADGQRSDVVTFTQN